MPKHHPIRTLLRSRPVVLTALAILTCVLAVSRLLRDPGPESSSFPSPIEVARTDLVLLDKRLHLPGQAVPFNGTVLERYPDGTLRSRSAVSNGLLHGLSQGWYTNGQLQVSEHFVAGASDGLRTKWYPSGAKLSEAQIADGRLHGRFRRWHENGTLSEDLEFADGQPEGVAHAWFPSGNLKARVVAQAGQPIEQQFWSDGERARANP